MRMAMALRPPAWLSPRLPVWGDLKVATVFEARGNRPTSGPTVRMMGLAGLSASMPGGHSSLSRRMPTPAPPRPASKRSGRSCTQERRRARSIYKTRVMGSFASMGRLRGAVSGLNRGKIGRRNHRLNFLHLDHAVRAVGLAVPAVNADLGLIFVVVPQDR